MQPTDPLSDTPEQRVQDLSVLNHALRGNHEQDLLRIEGWGVLSRRHAREEAFERFTAAANLIKAGKTPPEGYIELAGAFLTALKGPAWEAYQEPVTFDRPDE